LATAKRVATIQELSGNRCSSAWALVSGREALLGIHGPNVFSGYANNVGGTREVLVDGWLRTAERAVLDEDGFVTIGG
jgi:long-subunit acyl-CoA synthetase (AMP-forming)